MTREQEIIQRFQKRLEYARSKHSRTMFTSLVEEVGEVARAIEERNLKNQIDELLDVMVASYRLIDQLTQGDFPT